MITLYSYWRSAAAYRVRIALNMKGVPHHIVPVHLVRGPDGVPEHKGATYAAINPQKRVPALRLETGEVLIQSPAILEYIEETWPTPPLLPGDAVMRARVRGVASIICADTHPLQNVSVLNHLRGELHCDEDQVRAWITRWVVEGLTAVEALIGPGPFAFGAHPTLADVCLVPQVYGALRFGVPLDAFPKVRAAHEAMQVLIPVKNAHPSVQSDAE